MTEQSSGVRSVKCPTCDAPAGQPCRDMRSQSAWIGEMEKAFPMKGYHRRRVDEFRRVEKRCS